MSIILPPTSAQWIKENKTPENAFARAIISLVDQQVLDGDGSPEGQLKAPYKATYWDFTNQKLYFKSTPVTEAFGWVSLN